MAMTDGADHVELRPEARVELSRRGQVPGASEFGLVHAIDGDLEQLVDAANRRHLRMLLCNTIGADTDSAVSHDRFDVIVLLLGDSCALLSRCGLAPLLINLRADLAPFPLANIAKGQELLPPLRPSALQCRLGHLLPHRNHGLVHQEQVFKTAWAQIPLSTMLSIVDGEAQGPERVICIIDGYTGLGIKT